MKHLLTLVAGILIAIPNLAQAGQYTPPPGCTAFLTVQSKLCLVSHYWTCAGEPKGHRWVLTMGQDGPLSLAQVDRNYRWLNKQNYFGSNEYDVLGPETDPADFDLLLSKGRDDYAFTQNVYRNSIEVRRERVEGYDALPGTAVVIDGEPLEKTEFSYSIMPQANAPGYRVYGQQYLSKRFRIFLSGREYTESNGVEAFSDGSPVKFFEPGEPGFLSDTPIFGCDGLVSFLDTSYLDVVGDVR